MADHRHVWSFSLVDPCVAKGTCLDCGAVFELTTESIALQDADGTRVVTQLNDQLRETWAVFLEMLSSPGCDGTAQT